VSPTLTDNTKTTIGPVHIRTVITVVLGVAAVEITVRAVFRHGADSSLAILGVSRFLEGMLMIIVLFFGKPGLSVVGLRKRSAVSGLWRGVLWSAGFGGIVFLVFGALSVMGVDPLLFIKTPLPFNTGAVILFFLVGGVVSPIVEELFFRGVLFGFMRRWGVTSAVVLSSLLFVCAHHTALTRFSWIPFMGGVVFALAYEMEQNLMVPITLHMLGNMAIFVLSALSD
jgi:uncharacterized protein